MVASKQVDRFLDAFERFASAHERLAEAQAASHLGMSPAMMVRLRQLASRLRSTHPDDVDARFDVAAEIDKLAGPRPRRPEGEVGFGG